MGGVSEPPVSRGRGEPRQEQGTGGTTYGGASLAIGTGAPRASSQTLQDSARFMRSSGIPRDASADVSIPESGFSAGMESADPRAHPAALTLAPGRPGSPGRPASPGDPLGPTGPGEPRSPGGPWGQVGEGTELPHQG